MTVKSGLLKKEQELSTFFLTVFNYCERWFIGDPSCTSCNFPRVFHRLAVTSYNALIARLPIKRERVPATTTAVASAVRLESRDRYHRFSIFHLLCWGCCCCWGYYHTAEVVLLVIPHLLLALQRNIYIQCLGLSIHRSQLLKNESTRVSEVGTIFLLIKQFLRFEKK